MVFLSVFTHDSKYIFLQLFECEKWSIIIISYLRKFPLTFISHSNMHVHFSDALCQIGVSLCENTSGKQGFLYKIQNVHLSQWATIIWKLSAILSQPIFSIKNIQVILAITSIIYIRTSFKKVNPDEFNTLKGIRLEWKTARSYNKPA